MSLVIRNNTSETIVPRGIFLDRTRPVTDETAAYAVEVFWRFEDDPDMELERLGAAVPGSAINVPFDLQERPIVLIRKSQSATGESNRQPLYEQPSVTFSPPTAPTLARVEYVGDADIEVAYTANGGGGDINIFRDIDGEGFTLLTSAAFDTWLYTDTDAGIDGVYSYYLTQDGVEGQSTTLSDTVSGETAAAGSAPSGLSAVYDDVDIWVDLSWTNNGGTGLNIVEYKINLTGSWQIIVDNVGTSATSYVHAIDQTVFSRYFYYRVRNASNLTYSNEAGVFIPGTDSPI
jgi:hypothetical protein